jgi:glycosyltransferase involved in cell wall biosynthesis
MSHPFLLVLAPYAVVPPRYGGPLRVYNLCREISRSYEVRQFAQQAQRRQISLYDWRPVMQQVSPRYSEYSSRNPLSVALYALFSLRWSSPPVWQESMLRATAPGWLRRQLQEARVVQVEQPWQFGWAYRQLRGTRPIVLNTQNVEADLYTAARLSAPARLRGPIVRAVERQEAFALRHADHIFAVSPAERDALAMRYNVSVERFTIVPNGVDCAAFQPASRALREQRKRELGLSGKTVIVFAGSLHPPNIEAVQAIITWAQIGLPATVALLIVGSVGGAFSSMESQQLRFTGPVETTQPFFEAADIAVNPMRSGGGTNLKQLEFMAMGLPTLATPVGARGIPIVDGENGYISTSDEMLARLRRLLDQPDELAAVGFEGRRLVERSFDWSSIVLPMLAVYERLAAQYHSA